MYIKSHPHTNTEPQTKIIRCKELNSVQQKYINKTDTLYQHTLNIEAKPNFDVHI